MALSPPHPGGTYFCFFPARGWGEKRKVEILRDLVGKVERRRRLKLTRSHGGTELLRKAVGGGPKRGETLDGINGIGTDGEGGTRRHEGGSFPIGCGDPGDAGADALPDHALDLTLGFMSLTRRYCRTGATKGRGRRNAES